MCSSDLLPPKPPPQAVGTMRTESFGSFMMIAFLALRWSRRPSMAGMPAGIDDPAMAARLDDELRNLD